MSVKERPLMADKAVEGKRFITDKTCGGAAIHGRVSSCLGEASFSSKNYNAGCACISSACSWWWSSS